MRTLTQLALILLLAFAAIGVVNAKTASGPSPLCAGWSLADGLDNRLASQGKIESGYEVASGCFVAVKAGALSSRAARRQAMRDAGIPTSKQPVSQSANASGREYSYEVNGERMSVQQQTMDRSHPGEAHWEAGSVKTDPLTGEVRMNNYDRPALTSEKSKVDY